ncbi:hypothetical protein Tco_0921220 [Tanacetum coccineum]
MRIISVLLEITPNLATMATGTPLSSPRTIDQSASGKLRDKNTEESWALLEDLALYDNESWNDPRDFAKPVKAISLPQDVPSTSDRRLIELENQVQRWMEAHLAPMQPTQLEQSSTCHQSAQRNFVEVKSAVIDCKMAKIAVGEGITRKDFLDCHLPEEWEIARDAEINPFKDVLVFRRMIKFLGAIPINLKSNMWESEDLINNQIN